MFITQAIKLLTKAPLLTIYQSFIRPHLDQRDFLMWLNFKKTNCNNAILVRTFTKRISSTGKLYHYAYNP